MPSHVAPDREPPTLREHPANERTPLLSVPNDQPALSESRSPATPGGKGDPDAEEHATISASEEEEIIAAALGSAAERKETPASIVSKIILTLLCGLLLGTLIKAGVSANPDFDFGKALRKALGGGLSGALAMLLQVLLFMPLRTIMNYQYRFGKSFWQAASVLYAEGGYGRYYQGLGAAIVQAPVSRFGDTASNTFIFAIFRSNPTLDALPSPIKSFFAAVFASMFRIILTPIDTIKTTLQTQGAKGWKILRVRVRMYGVGGLWYGAVATAAATIVGFFPWFGVYNYLKLNLPPDHNVYEMLVRQAVIGFCASLVSDTVSNSLRVVKTYRQVDEMRVSYLDAARAVITLDGLRGLFLRGLRTRLVANGCQSITFSILWRIFMDLWEKGTNS